MINVAIVENDDSTRERLENAINDDKEMFFCGAYASAEELIEKYTFLDVHVVIMDIDLGKTRITGIEAVKRLSVIKKEPEVQFIMCTTYFDDDKIYESYAYGAHGYLNKHEANDEEIMLAVKQVCAGYRPMSPRIAQRTFAHFEQKRFLKSLPENLTHREREALLLLENGNSYKMAADTMNIEYSTFNGYVKSIYKKLKVNCLAAAIKILNQ